MNAVWSVRGVCERRVGRIQVMDASLVAAGGEPVTTSLAAMVDRLRTAHDVSIVIADAGGLGR